MSEQGRKELPAKARSKGTPAAAGLLRAGSHTALVVLFPLGPPARCIGRAAGAAAPVLFQALTIVLFLCELNPCVPCFRQPSVVFPSPWELVRALCV